MSFILASVSIATIHQVILKLASYHETWGQVWLAYMGAGYVIGILPPLFLTFAYRGNNASVILAITVGISTPLVFSTLFIFFREPLTRIQILGLIFASVGVMLLFTGSIQESSTDKDRQDRPAASDVTGNTT